MDRFLLAGILGSALSLITAGPVFGGKPFDSGSVLIVVNDNTAPEPGTGTKPAGQYVADHYAAVRGIPADNIVHIQTNQTCLGNPSAWDCWNINWQEYVSGVREPIRNFLKTRRLTRKIKYIVPTYGVPTHINHHPLGQDGLSVDSSLAIMNTPYADIFNMQNPLYDPDPNSKRALRFAVYNSPFYAVVRLDGPSAEIAARLVDKAVAAEKGIRRGSGTGYFDWRNLTGADDYATADRSMTEAFNHCVSAGLECALNDQVATGGMINNAPNTLWAWGWYSGPSVNDVYTFASGAVGAQLTSYTAVSVRRMDAGAWVPLWLEKGITATWGATGEPNVSGYATGDVLLNRLWKGASFGDAAYLACPSLAWKMIFVGDPLYKPKFVQ